MKEQIVGPSDLLNPAGMSQTTLQNLDRKPNDRQPKRKVYSYTPAAGRMNVFEKTGKRYIKKRDDEENRVLSHGAYTTVNYARQGRLTSTLNKLDPENKRITQFMPRKPVTRMPPNEKTRWVEPARSDA
jgi:hypothetical protein